VSRRMPHSDARLSPDALHERATHASPLRAADSGDRCQLQERPTHASPLRVADSGDRCQLQEGLTTAGVAALPVVRYAMGCIAITAAVSGVLRTVPDAAIAVFGGLVMLAGMVLVAIVGRVAAGRDAALRSALRRPALVLVWGVVGAAICVLALLISTAFWGLPIRSHPSPCADAAGSAAACCALLAV
jgi:hypothetical protein